jgi:hypothetical protein
MRYLDEICTIIQNTIKLTEPIENIKINTNLQNVSMHTIAFVKIVVEI